MAVTWLFYVSLINATFKNWSRQEETEVMNLLTSNLCRWTYIALNDHIFSNITQLIDELKTSFIYENHLAVLEHFSLWRRKDILDYIERTQNLYSTLSKQRGTRKNPNRLHYFWDRLQSFSLFRQSLPKFSWWWKTEIIRCHLRYSKRPKKRADTLGRRCIILINGTLITAPDTLSHIKFPTRKPMFISLMYLWEVRLHNISLKETTGRIERTIVTDGERINENTVSHDQLIW